MLIICSPYHLSSGGSKESANPPASELRIPSTTHSHAAGRLGINWRGNVVNSREFFLSASQPVAGGYCYMKASLSVSIIIARAATFQRMNWPHLVTQLERGVGWGVFRDGSTFAVPTPLRKWFPKTNRNPRGPAFFPRFPPWATLGGACLWGGWERAGPGLAPGQEIS